MLEELDLTNMNIISVPEDMFLDNLFITNIILKSNYLINLDSDILAYLTNLRKLDLSFNLFMGLGEHFFNEGLFFVQGRFKSSLVLSVLLINCAQANLYTSQAHLLNKSIQICLRTLY